MALVRWEPAREVASLQNEVNRLFSTFFDAPAQPQGVLRRWIPAMDLVERDDHYLLRADLPGLDESDVAIEVEGDVLTISGERTVEDGSERDGTYRVERASGAFKRSLTLPEGVDAEQIAATFDKGVLEVRVPKPVEQTPRRVTITPGKPVVEGEAATADDAS